MNSRTSRRFWEYYHGLPIDVQRAARKAYRLFRDNPAHPGLRFERLACDRRLWAVRVTRDYRAVGLREGNTIAWAWIGNHEEFDRLFPR